MKKRIGLVFLIFFLGGMFFPQLFSAQADEVCTISVTTPSGGETYTEGDTASINWTASTNVDKVAIMYKSDAYHGNWVAFTHPNTGSYSWTVDVGNTTNTQFFIQITGYETDKGQCTSQSGYFTVHQKPDAPPLPTQSPVEPTTSPATTTNNEAPRYPLSHPTYTPKHEPTIAPTPITWRSVTIASWFYFSGSLTTDLTNFNDLSKVENFTLDTVEGWTFVWIETLDLTDPDKKAALANIDQYWTVERWSIWIETEWWATWSEPVEVTFKNEELTASEPELRVSETSEGKKAEEVVKLTSTQPGEVKAEMTGAAKVEIFPKVELKGEKEIKTTKTSYLLSGHSSHRNLDYEIKVNGETKKTSLDGFNEESGEFTVKLDDLVLGANHLELYYKQKDENDYHLAGDKTVLVDRLNFWQYLGIGTGIVLLVGFLLGAGMMLEKKLSFSRKITKLIKKIKLKLR